MHNVHIHIYVCMCVPTHYISIHRDLQICMQIYTDILWLPALVELFPLPNALPPLLDFSA